MSPSFSSAILCFVLLEKCEVEDVLDATALSPWLRFLLPPLECDELEALDGGTGGGSIARAGGGYTGDGEALCCDIANWVDQDREREMPKTRGWGFSLTWHVWRVWHF